LAARPRADGTSLLGESSFARQIAQV